MQFFFTKFADMSHRILLTLLLTLAPTLAARAISFNLDSIAEWGRFPRFCVDTYRWGDKFFNGYDSTYVKGTGYKFNVKFTTDSWFDYYNFVLPEHSEMHMRSEPNTTMGVHLTYLAVSAGYDYNISKLFGRSGEHRTRYSFGFNCALGAVEMQYVNNKVGTRITRFGPRFHPDKVNLPFSGIDNSTWNIDTYYFFNNKHYSQAAAFGFSKLQRRSQGSFYAGLSFSGQNYNFDFEQLPAYMRVQLPSSWTDYRYRVQTYGYAVRLGYGYNWVLPRGWLVGVSESPILGLRKGYINSDTRRTSFGMANRLRAAVVWNSGRYFAGAVASSDIKLIYDKRNTMANAYVTAQLCAGYRFNLW